MPESARLKKHGSCLENMHTTMAPNIAAGLKDILIENGKACIRRPRGLWFANIIGNDSKHSGEPVLRHMLSPACKSLQSARPQAVLFKLSSLVIVRLCCAAILAQKLPASTRELVYVGLRMGRIWVG